MKKGADASAKDAKGNYPVHYAAKSGAGQALQELVIIYSDIFSIVSFKTNKRHCQHLVLISMFLIQMVRMLFTPHVITIKRKLSRSVHSSTH